jgi:hypothetical protein
MFFSFSHPVKAQNSSVARKNPNQASSKKASLPEPAGMPSRNFNESVWLLDIPAAPVKLTLAAQDVVFSNASNREVSEIHLGIVKNKNKKYTILSQESMVKIDGIPSGESKFTGLAIYSKDVNSAIEKNAKLAVVIVKFIDGSIWQLSRNSKKPLSAPQIHEQEHEVLDFSKTGDRVSQSSLMVKGKSSDYKTRSNEDIVDLLSSKDPKEAGAAAQEIFSRGAAMIPHLMNLEGRNSCFYGVEALGEWNSPGLSRAVPSCLGTYRVTVEVAALFLVSAIFYEDLKFAEPPALCDFSSEKLSCVDNGNTSERIRKAWNATKAWEHLMETQGIDFLRERNRDPFKDSGLSF